MLSVSLSGSPMVIISTTYLVTWVFYVPTSRKDENLAARRPDCLQARYDDLQHRPCVCPALQAREAGIHCV